MLENEYMNNLNEDIQVLVDLQNKKKEQIDKTHTLTSIKAIALVATMMTAPLLAIDIIKEVPAWLVAVTGVMWISAPLILLFLPFYLTSPTFRELANNKADNKLNINNKKQNIINKHFKSSKNQKDIVDFFSSYEKYDNNIKTILSSLKYHFLSEHYFEALDDIQQLTDIVKTIQLNNSKQKQNKEESQKVNIEWKKIYETKEEESLEIEIGDTKTIRKIL